MKFNHFVLDDHDQLRKLRRRALKKLLTGQRSAEACAVGRAHELALVSVICDDDLLPERAYLLRMPLTDGAFTPADLLVLRALSHPDCATPDEAARHHLSGWPSDLLRQLAVALDVPVADLDGIFHVGGPVLLAAVTGVSLGRALRKMGRM